MILIYQDRPLRTCPAKDPHVGPACASPHADRPGGGISARFSEYLDSGLINIDPGTIQLTRNLLKTMS